MDADTDPSMEEEETEPWPCGSQTIWTESGKATEQRYEWDAHGNLVRKEDAGEIFTARFDATGQIATEEVREWPSSDGARTNFWTIHRVVDNGLLVREVWTREIDGWDSSGSTTFRYEGGRLVEKHTLSGTFVDVLTTVSYQEPDERIESDEVRSGPTSGTGLRIWKGDPWYEFHDVSVTETIVARDLDPRGRELRVKRWRRGQLDYDEVVDIERGPNGAPVREVRVSKDARESRIVTYQTSCED